MVIALAVLARCACAAPASSLSFCPPHEDCFYSSFYVGIPGVVRVSAIDANGDLATDYEGTVAITSSDHSAALPAAHTFTNADNSTYYFVITFDSAAPDSTHTITAIDAANSLAANVQLDVTQLEPIGTLSFAPAEPTSRDSITVTLRVNPHWISSWCPVEQFKSDHSVYIFSFPGSCSPETGLITNQAAIGTLPVGTYDVFWGFPDDFYGQRAAGRLVVTQAPALPAPALALWATLFLACGLPLLTYGVGRRRRCA